MHVNMFESNKQTKILCRGGEVVLFLRAGLDGLCIWYAPFVRVETYVGPL